MNKAKSMGFTLVELLIVIIVIAILATIVTVSYNGVQNSAKVSAAKNDLANFKKAMLAYKAERGELPPTGDSWNYNTNPPSCSNIDSLIAALRDAGYTGFKAQDPWGNCWGYDDNDCNTGSVGGSSTYIESIGPDGLNGGSDDISILVSIKEATGC